MPLMFNALWDYRYFVFSTVKREFQTRYRASLLGAFWTVAQPLTMILIYTVVFGQIMQPSISGHEETPYAFSLYLCAGVIFWGLFSETLTRMTTVFVDHATLIKKTAFPRVCLPAIVTGTALVNFSIILGLYLFFLVLVKHMPGPVILVVLPLLAIQLSIAIGLGLLLGTINVFFRDAAQFVVVLLQFWFWLTPIVYIKDIVPAKYQQILELNPLEPLMSAYQGIFLEHAVPDFDSLLFPISFALICLTTGGWIFRRHSTQLADEL